MGLTWASGCAAGALWRQPRSPDSLPPTPTHRQMRGCTSKVGGFSERRKSRARSCTLACLVAPVRLTCLKVNACPLSASSRYELLTELGSRPRRGRRRVCVGAPGVQHPVAIVSRIRLACQQPAFMAALAAKAGCRITFAKSHYSRVQRSPVVKRLTHLQLSAGLSPRHLFRSCTAPPAAALSHRRVVTHRGVSFVPLLCRARLLLQPDGRCMSMLASR